MKKLIFLCAPLCIFGVSTAQTFNQGHLAYGIDYFIHPEVNPKKYSTVLIVTNASLEAISEMRNISQSKKVGYNVIFSIDVQSPLSNNPVNWDNIFLSKQINGVFHLYVRNKTDKIVTSGWGAGAFGFGATSYAQTGSVFIEATFIDTEFKGNALLPKSHFLDFNNCTVPGQSGEIEVASYYAGWVGGKADPACFNSFYRIFENLDDFGVAIK